VVDRDALGDVSPDRRAVRRAAAVTQGSDAVGGDPPGAFLGDGARRDARTGACVGAGLDAGFGTRGGPLPWMVIRPTSGLMSGGTGSGYEKTLRCIPRDQQ